MRQAPGHHGCTAAACEGLVRAEIELLLTCEVLPDVGQPEPVRRFWSGLAHRPTCCTIHDGEIQARENDLDAAGTFTGDGLVADASVTHYGALLLAGGTVNPDRLRVDPDAVSFVREFVESGKPVAAICHGPWTLIEAGVVEGRTVTSFPSIRTDLRNAGADVVDQDVVVDGNLITSRSPDDLPVFCDTIVAKCASNSTQEEVMA